MRLKSHTLAGLALAGTIALGLGPAAAEAKLRLDYAYYNPVSLVLKDKGWLSRILRPRGSASNGC